MELLIHLSLEKDMFNLAFGIEAYHPSGLMLALSTSLKSPVLMHQLLAFSSRHLAYVHPERSAFYEHQAVALQTRAISMFNAAYASSGVYQSNCVIIVLFASILGHHTLADALAMRPAEGLQAFMQHYVRCIETHRGIYTIAETAWPMLMQSELQPILSLSQAFTSREPRGQHCRLAKEMVEASSKLDEIEKEACLTALRYLQVGFDAATAEGKEENRFHMVCTWTMLLEPRFAKLLQAMQPEALVILAYYAEMLHHAKDLWQVRDAGTYIFTLVSNHLDESAKQWLEPPRKTIQRLSD
ncbi:hypothetical protein E8E12_005173 [Didymella heteroderae]|uniref:Uncharacterized protein n=1 Tax=Didymella heteroderae TaxID=1769908 RepID=A0A9P4WUD8_9PLEO|nr:hypothetical protein E8E12_005173 [Didymella heteroderae]